MRTDAADICGQGNVKCVVKYIWRLIHMMCIFTCGQPRVVVYPICLRLYDQTNRMKRIQPHKQIYLLKCLPTFWFFCKLVSWFCYSSSNNFNVIYAITYHIKIILIQPFSFQRMQPLVDIISVLFAKDYLFTG